ncbi:MAG: RDD family protein [bacterium]|nr:RDD family protein [bacterium]
MTEPIEPKTTGETDEQNPEKPELFNRYLAKFIDLLLVLALAKLDRIFGFVAPLMGMTYILISDGFFEGKSLGKKFVGLQVVIERETLLPCNFKHSTLRNLPIGVVVLFLVIPFWGWVLFFTLGLAILGVEAYQIYQDPSGLRLGDLIAETRVLETKNPG